MPCPECGTELVKSMRFCHNCGWDSKLAAAGRAASTAGHRPPWKRATMSVCLAIAAVFMVFVLLVPRGGAQTTLVIDQPAPDFTLESVDGGQVRLSDLKGKPVIINFWASWCGPCRKEMPDFQAVYEQYKDAGLQVYGINVGESKVAVRDFRETVGAKFPVLLDTHEEAQNAYKILPLPATFFVDSGGKIRAIYQYQMSRSQMEAEVLRLLGNTER